MIAIIKGDIIASRKIQNPERWMLPLKQLLETWGQSPKNWELVWGDFFQIEVPNPEDALRRALIIKALIKSVEPENAGKKQSSIDVRMAIGIGEKTYNGDRISESNGPAFVNAGEKFEKLNKEKVNLAIQTPWKQIDEDINLNLKLAGIFMDEWTVSSAQLVELFFKHPQATQTEIGEMLGIRQNSVSGRWTRSHIEEIKAVEISFNKKIKQALQK